MPCHAPRRSPAISVDPSGTSAPRACTTPLASTPPRLWLSSKCSTCAAEGHTGGSGAAVQPQPQPQRCRHSRPDPQPQRRRRARTWCLLDTTKANDCCQPGRQLVSLTLVSPACSTARAAAAPPLMACPLMWPPGATRVAAAGSSSDTRLLTGLSRPRNVLRLHGGQARGRAQDSGKLGRRCLGRGPALASRQGQRG